MNREDNALVLARGLRHQAGGRYNEAVADFMAMLDLPADAVLATWQQRSSLTSEAIEPLIRALRELEISDIAMGEYLAAIDRPVSAYRGFSSIDKALLANRERTRLVAQAYLRRHHPGRRREHLEMMLDIVENEAADQERGLSPLAFRHLRPIHARVRLITARQLLAKRNYARARMHLERAIQIAPCYGPAYRLLGEALVGLGHGTAAARAFDCAAAFWNPDWWPIEFSPGIRMRVPGIAIRGHDIFFWNDTFIAVKVSLHQRRLKQLTLTILRYANNIYRTGRGREDYGLGRPLYRRIAGAILRVPGALWIWRRIRGPAASVVRTKLRPLFRPAQRCLGGARRLIRSAAARIRSAVMTWLAPFLPRRSPSEVKPQRGWRARLSLWLAEIEIMWGAQPALRAASLQEILDLLDKAEA